jgi:hypothetical protein
VETDQPTCPDATHAEADARRSEIGKRVDRRHDLQTQAFVSISSLPPRAYLVREVSRGGMFLGFRDPHSTRQELEQYGIEKGAPVDIAFVVTTGDNKERCNVRARIVRITRTGLGVAFATHNPPQLAALRKLFLDEQEDLAS